MMSGALIFDDYFNLIKKNKITNLTNINSQIQPSSIDLSLSNECYEIKASFLTPKNKVRDKLERIIIKEIDIKTPKILRKNKIYLIRLNEKLNLDNFIKGHCNPKSTTGRINIFCRRNVRYEKKY